MGTNVSVDFKELNDMRGNLMAVNFTSLPSHAVSRVEQTFSITGSLNVTSVGCVFRAYCVFYFVKTRNKHHRSATNAG